MAAWACVKIVVLSGVVCRLAAISRALASAAHSSGSPTANFSLMRVWFSGIQFAKPVEQKCENVQYQNSKFSSMVILHK